jgi:hypothetical protein
MRSTPKSFWTYQPASETPTLDQAIAAGVISTCTKQSEWDQLSPGMKRAIMRNQFVTE